MPNTHIREEGRAPTLRASRKKDPPGTRYEVLAMDGKTVIAGPFDKLEAQCFMIENDESGGLRKVLL